VIGAPLVLGGVYPWGMASTAAAALLALALALAGSPNRSLPLTMLAIAVLGAFGWSVLQALPLPCSVAEVFARASAEQLRTAHRMLGLPTPGWCTLSRDPAATREEVVKGMAIVSGFLAALVLCRGGHRRWVLGSVGAAAIVLAAVAFGHELLDAKSVFGLYEPVEVRDAPLLTPLLNLNSAGGLLAMCVPLLIGLALAEHATPARLAYGSGAVLVASAVLMTRSRGAIGALVAGLLLLALLAAVKRRRSGRSRATAGVRTRLESLGIPVVLVFGLGLAVYAWHEEVVAEFERSNLDKFQVILQGLRFSLQAPWVGVGRGAFAATFASFFNTLNRFEYAENFVVQWLTEWGYPVALLLLAVMGVAVARALRTARSPERLGALCGLVAFTAQSLVDVGLELVGVAVVAAVLLAASTAERVGRRARGPGASTRPVGPVLVLAGAVALALLWAPIHAEHHPYLEARMRDAFERGDGAGFQRTLRRAVLAHPSDPVFPVFAAAEALRRGDRRAGHWINRALQLVPGWPAPHMLAAQWLLRAGHRKQALLELQVAVGLDRWHSRTLLCQMAEFDLESVATLRPKGLERRLFLQVLAPCFAPETPRSARLDALILAEFPDDGGAWLREAQRRFAGGDFQGAVQAAERAAGPGTTQPALELRARALAALGRRPEALEVLRLAERTSPDLRPLIEVQARILADMGDHPGMVEAIGRLRGLAGASPEAVARVFMLEGSLEQLLGNPVAAMASFEEAHSITGETSALRAIAALADERGDRRRAAWAYTQLCDLAPNEAGPCARKAELLSALRRELPAGALQPKPE
jgi:tetratricopeptide (TPR) repeat protein